MIRVTDVVDREGLEAAWRVRHEVFVREQHVPIEVEVDARDTDPTTSHAIAHLGDDVVATGRILADPGHPGEVHVGRVAVLRQARGCGIGAVLMAHLEGVALARHGVQVGGLLVVRVALSAQEGAMGFYSRLGYRVVTGERYLDAGIWHQDMERRIEV